MSKATTKPAPALVHQAHHDLAGLVRPLDELVLDPQNARQHNERNLATIKASLSKFGQRKPVVVQRQGMIVRAGNGTVMAARALGWTGVAALVVDEDDAKATAFALVDNRSAELAEWDWAALDRNLQSLEGLDGVDFTLDDLGWAEADLEALALTNQWQDTEPPEPGGGEGRATLQGSPIRFTPEERTVVDKAVKRLRADGTYDTEGAAVAAICGRFLEG